MKHAFLRSRARNACFIYKPNLKIWDDSCRLDSPMSIPPLQRLIHDVEMIQSPSLEMSHLSRRKYLTWPTPVHRNPVTGPGCVDESIPITFPVDGATLRRA